MRPSATHTISPDELPDAELVRRCLDRDEPAVRELTRRHNRRLFRLARGVVRNDAEAEDIVQASYVRAFLGLERFRGDAVFGTWMARIVINEALGRLRRRRPTVAWDAEPEAQLQARILAFPDASHPADPETSMARRELVAALERAIDALPDPFRVVFIARLVEGLTIEETAVLLNLRPETDGARCQRLTERVIAAIERTRQAGPGNLFRPSQSIGLFRP